MKKLSYLLLFFIFQLNAQITIPYYQDFENDNFYFDIQNIGMEVATQNLPTGVDQQETYCIESGEVASTNQIQQCYLQIVDEAKRYSWDLSSDHQTRNDNSLKLTVHDNDIPKMGGDPDSRTRSEIVFRAPAAQKLYYKWDIYIPNDNEFIEQNVPGSYHRLFQLKPQGRDTNGNKYNITANTIAALDYLYKPNAATDDLKRNLHFYVDPPSIYKDRVHQSITNYDFTSNRKRMLIKDGIEKGKWNTIIMKIRSSHQSNGYFQIWVNGNPVVITGYRYNDFTYDASINFDTSVDASKLFSENLVMTNDDVPIPVEYGIKLGHYRQFLTSTTSVYIDNFSITENYPLSIPTFTQLTPDYCEKTLKIEDMHISCTPIVNATNYTFHFTSDDLQEYQIESSSPVIDLRNNPLLIPNKRYAVKVKSRGDNFSFDYGNTCYMRMPRYTKISTDDCNMLSLSNGNTLTCYGFSNTSKYRFRFKNSANDYKWIDSDFNSITIPVDPYFSTGSYEVQVRELDTDYGEACTFNFVSSTIGSKVSEGKTSFIYPNPFKNKLKLPIIHDAIATLKILNLKGTTVFSSEISKKTDSIDLSFLTNGFYFLSIEGQNTFIYNKIIKH